MRLGKLLIIDDEKDIRELMQEIFVEEGYKVETAANGEQARKQWHQFMPDVIFLDVWMPDIDGISLLKEIQQEDSMQNTKVVMMSGHGTIETAIEATKLGAYDFLEKPLSLAKLTVTAQRAMENSRLNQENRQLKQNFPEQFMPVGKSKAIIQLRETIDRLSKFTMPIFVEGESGAGKHYLAQALHKTSPRKLATLVEMSAEKLNQLTSGETTLKKTLEQMKQADLGTLVVSQLEQLSPAGQKLLFDLIENHKIEFNNHTINLDIRLIALSKHPLEKIVSDQSFHKELYERLKVIPIQVPSLRQHTEDIPELIDFFINHFVTHEGLEYRHFSVPAQNALRQYSWPGNLKELKNLIQRILILGESEVNDDEVKSYLQESRQDSDIGLNVDTRLNLKAAKEQFEAAYLSQLLRETSGNVSETAKRSGVDRTNLYRKLKVLGIDPKNPV